MCRGNESCKHRDKGSKRKQWKARRECYGERDGKGQRMMAMAGSSATVKVERRDVRGGSVSGSESHCVRENCEIRHRCSRAGSGMRRRP